MSSALNTAIYNRLAGVEVMTGRYAAAQATIAAILATDKDTAAPAVYEGNLNQTPIPLDDQGVRKPVVTFRPSGGIADEKFATGTLVDDGIYDLEIWTFDTLANTISDIGDAVETLLDRRKGCPPMVLPTGYESVWLEAFVLLNEIYDEQRNGWIGLVRYRVIEARN